MIIDHQKVLRAYIKHVVECEGTDFLYGTHGNPEGLNAGELSYLMQAHLDVDQGWFAWPSTEVES